MKQIDKQFNMEQRYEIQDTETRNPIGEFSIEDEALELVRIAIEDWGFEAAASLVRGYGEGSSVASQVVAGRGLLERALSAATHV